MSSLSRRARLGAAALIALGTPFVGASHADAHTCAAVHAGPVTTPGCHPPPNPGDHATCPNAGTNEGYVIVCVGGN